MEKRENSNDVLALVIKLVIGLVALAAIVFAGIQIYKKYKEKKMFELCDCDEDYFDDELCDCDCDCDCEVVTEDAPEEA